MTSYKAKQYIINFKDKLGYENIALAVLLVFILTVDSNRWFENLVYILIIIPAAIVYYKKRHRQSLSASPIISLLAFSFYTTIILFDKNGKYFNIIYFVYLYLFYTCLTWKFNDSNKIFYLNMTYFAIVIGFLFYGLFFVIVNDVTRFEYGGTNANRVAVLLIYPFAWLAWHVNKNHPNYSLVSIALFLIVILMDFYTVGSRSIFILAIIFTVFYFVNNVRKTDIKNYFFASSGIAISILLLFLNTNLYEKFISRGGSYRSEIWADVLNKIIQNDCLLFGCGKPGAATFLNYFDNPHGLFISTLYYYGITGLTLLGVFLYFCFRNTRGFYQAWLASCLGFFIFTHTEILGKPSIFWLYFWLPLFMGFIDKKIHYEYSFATYGQTK
jgi:hypothetical protein